MTVGADKSGVDTTSQSDSRITPAGRIVRRFKLDELPQFFHVLTGVMSLVGPRPNVSREVQQYTAAERSMLLVRPGITDFSSIVFANLGELVMGLDDPNAAYKQFVRPWKSRLTLLYLESATFWLDVQLVILTAYAIFAQRAARGRVVSLIRKYGGDTELLEVCSQTLKPTKGVPPEELSSLFQLSPYLRAANAS